MHLVHAHAPDFVILVIKYRDLVRLLQHLNCHVSKNSGQSFGPTLIACARIGHATQLVFAAPLHLVRRHGLEDGIAIIADQLGGGVYKRGGISWQRPAVDIEGLSLPYLVGHRARTS